MNATEEQPTAGKPYAMRGLGVRGSAFSAAKASQRAEDGFGFSVDESIDVVSMSGASRSSRKKS